MKNIFYTLLLGAAVSSCVSHEVANDTNNTKNHRQVASTGIDTSKPVITKKMMINHLRLSYSTVGNPKAKRLMLFLHGAPENHYTWKEYLQAFGSDDVFAVAMSMRGYYPSEVPKNVADLTLAKMASDAFELAKALGYEKFTLVGHDWGAATAWQTTIMHPTAVEKLVIFSNLHPAHYAMAYYQLREQKDAVDSYIPWILEDKAPWTKEATLDKDVKHFRDLTFTKLSSPFVPKEMQNNFVKMWKHNHGESIQAIYNSYKALRDVSKTWPLNNIFQSLGTCKDPRISSLIVNTPVLLFYGAQDPYTNYKSQMKYKDSGCHPRTEYVLYEDADHWLHHEKRDDAIARIREFIK